MDPQDPAPRAPSADALSTEDEAAWTWQLAFGHHTQSLRVAVLIATVSTIWLLLTALLDPSRLDAAAGPISLIVASALLHIVLLKRAREPRQVVPAHVVIHGGLVTALCVLAARTPDLTFYAAFLGLTVAGPVGAETWPRRVAVAAFGLVPVGFVLAHLLLDHGHSPRAVGQTTFVLSMIAVLGVGFMTHKHDTARDAFFSRRALARANAELGRSMQRLVRTQSELVRSEKLAVLGQLVAGVAHELNTPLGAIAASGDTLQQDLPSTIQALPAALADMDPVQRAGFERLLHCALTVRQASLVNSREERRQRRQLTGLLRAADVPDARARAASLAELGCIDDIEPLLPLLRHPESAAVLDQIDRIATLLRSTATVRLAASRASKIVQALKRYAHPGDRSGAAVEAALAESVETVLTLYANHLKQGIVVKRNYDVPGIVTARHEALNQVWTNLVHNALHALDGTGTLTVRVEKQDAAHVRVEVEDDGPGVPPELRDRIFEPFFTTKVAGEGSGLGLAICHDIVEQHGGRLELESAPGRTVFRVVLPREAAPTTEPAAG